MSKIIGNITATPIPRSDWAQTDENKADFIRNKPTKDDAIDLLAEMEVIDPVTDSDGAILIDENGNILSL